MSKRKLDATDIGSLPQTVFSLVCGFLTPVSIALNVHAVCRAWRNARGSGSYVACDFWVGSHEEPYCSGRFFYYLSMAWELTAVESLSCQSGWMQRALGCCPNLRHLKITDYLTLKGLELFGLDSWWPEKTNGKVVQLDVRLASSAGKLMELVELVRKLQAHANIVALEILGPVIETDDADELIGISELVSQTLRRLAVRDSSSSVDESFNP
jgi:hypothetical protein